MKWKNSQWGLMSKYEARKKSGSKPRLCVAVKKTMIGFSAGEMGAEEILTRMLDNMR